MGYTTDFMGSVQITPPLNAQEIAFLNKFAETRRMKRKKGPYYVDAGGDFGQASEPDIINHNEPAQGQPGLWCQWIPTEDGSAIEWDGNEKFYEAEAWMAYIIDHFLKPGCKAASKLPFLQANHSVNGVIEAQGEEASDRWRIVVENNVVTVEAGEVVYG